MSLKDFILGEEYTDVQKARLKLLENREWFDKNFKELQKKYGGKWIAIVDKKVVIEDEDPETIKRLIDFPTREDILLILVPKGEVEFEI